MKRFITVFVLCLGIFAQPATAGHLKGAEISYEHITAVKYLITLRLHSDCATPAPPFPPFYTVESSNCSVNQTFQFPASSGNLVDYLGCPGVPANGWNCGGGVMPGVKEFVYQDTVYLSGFCDDWVFSYLETSRNNSITNLNSPGSYGIYVEARMDNSTYNAGADTIWNSSPYFTGGLSAAVCLGEEYTYWPGAIDPDGDSLSYSLNYPMRGAGVNDTMEYNFGYNMNSPLISLPPFSFDNTTGEMTFRSIMIDHAVVAVRVQEWRKISGTMTVIGEYLRDLQFDTWVCTNEQPTLDTMVSVTGGTSSGVNEYDVCVGDSFSFKMAVIDSNSDNVFVGILKYDEDKEMIWDSIGTCISCASDTVIFIWEPTDKDIGTHHYQLYVMDDQCPMQKGLGLNFTVNVTEGTYGGPDQVYCGEPVMLQASGGSSFTWSIVTGMGGDPIDTTSSGNFSCNPCAAPLASPSSNTSYIVSSNFSGTCQSKDTVNVAVVPSFSLSTSADTSICLNGIAELTAFASDTATYSYWYSWAPTEFLYSTDDSTVLAQPTSTTEYFVTVTSSTGCQLHDSLTVSVVGISPTITVVNDTFMCAGDTAQLNVSQVTDAIYEWSPATDLDDPNIQSPLAYPSTPTTYTITVTEYGVDTIFWVQDFASATNGDQSGPNWGTNQATCGGCRDVEVQSGQIQAEHTGSSPNGGYWYSDTIDISGYIDVDVKMDLSQSGYTASDSVNAYYSLDGGSFVALTNGLQAGAFSAVTATATGLTGNTIYLKVNFIIGSNSDFGYLDSLRLIGKQLSPCPASEPVAVNSDTPYTLSTSASTNPICRLEQTTLTTTPSVAGSYTYSWTPTAYVSTGTNEQQSTTAIPPDTMTYYVQAMNGGCIRNDTITVNVKPRAPIMELGYDSTMGINICTGDSTIIYAQGTEAAACDTVSGSCSTALSDTIDGYSPAGNLSVGMANWTSFSRKSQSILWAGDLVALGLSANDMITAIAFNVFSGSGTHGNYEIRMGCTLNSGWDSDNSPFETGLKTVKSSFSFTPTTGWNTIDLDNPYVWDGSNHLIIEICTDAFAASDIEIGKINMGQVSTLNQRSLVAISNTVAQCSADSGDLVSATEAIIPQMKFQFCPAPTTVIPNLTYSWSPTTDLATPNDSATLAYPATTTVYTVEAYDASSTGCVGSASISVNAGAPYSITSISASADSFCSGNTATLSLTTDSAFSFNYSWSPGNTLDDSTIASPVATPTTTTDYIATLTRQFWGCEQKDTVTVTLSGIAPVPTITTSADSICPGDSAQLNVTLASALFDSVYSWSPTTGLSDTTIGNPKVSVTATTRYTVTITDGDCSDTASVLIKFINAGVTAVADTTGSCDSVQLSATPYGMSIPIATLTTCGTNGSPYGNTVDYDIGGYNSANRFSGWANPFNASVEDSRVEYIYTKSEMVSAGMDTTNGEVITAIAFRLTNNSPGNTYNNFTVKLGCTASDVPNTSGWRNPASMSTVYSGTYTSTTGWNTISLSSPYDWTGDSNLVIQICHDNSTTANADTFFYYWPSPVSNKAMYATGTGSGCSFSPGLTSQLRPILKLTSALPEAGFTYSWSPGLTMEDSTRQNPTVLAPVSGTTAYTVTVTGGTCSVSDVTDTVDLSSVSSINFDITSISATPDSFCSGATTSSLSVSTDSSFTYTYNWSPGTSLDDSTIASPVASPAITTEYWVAIVNSATGCSRKDTVVVDVTETPLISVAVAEDSICPGDSTQLTTTIAAGLEDTIYSWTPTTGLSNATIANPLAFPSVSTTYTLTVTNGSCADTATIFIGVAAVTADTVGVCDSDDSLMLSATPVDMGATPITTCGTNGTLYGSTAEHIIEGTTVNNMFLFNPMWNIRFEALYTKAELDTAGMDTALGEVITEIAIHFVGTAGNDFDITVQLGCTDDTLCTNAGWINPASMTTVYSGPFSPVDGWNTITLSSPYDWAGSENLIVNICRNDTTNNGIDTLSTFNAGVNHYSYGINFANNGCGLTSGFAQAFKPFMRFTSAPPQQMTYSWSPGIAMDDSTLQNPTVLVPSGTTTFTVTASNGVCTVSGDVDVSCECDTVRPYIEGSATVDTTEYLSDSTFRIKLSELIKCNTITGASDFELDCSAASGANLTACLANSVISATGDGCPNPPDSSSQWISVEIDDPVPASYLNNWRLQISGTCTIRDMCWNLMTSVGSNGASGAAVILPVELLYFDAVLNGEIVDVNWETAFEVNTSHYVVERAVNGLQFEAIGQVPAQGPFFRYELKDTEPQIGINYYRLRVVDTDGTVNYTKSVAVRVNAPELKLIDVHPVPTLDLVHVTVLAKQDQELTVTAKSMIGQEVIRKTISTISGENTITLNLSGLKAGVYFVRLSTDGHQGILTRVVKQ